jgi:transcriptional regulator with XRE-family HTH domain
MSITASQCRAARALINWSQDDLSKASAVGRATLANFESEKSTPYERTLRDIQTALEAAGVIFIDTGETAQGNGVTIRAEII